MPLSVCTFLPTQTSSKSRPKLFHPIITLPQPSSSYSLLCHFHYTILALSPSPSTAMVIQFAITPTFFCPSFTILQHPSPSYTVLHRPIFLLQRLQCHPLPSQSVHCHWTMFFTLLLCHEVVVSECLNEKLSVKNMQDWKPTYKKSMNQQAHRKENKQRDMLLLYISQESDVSLKPVYFFNLIHINASAAWKCPT